MCSLNSSGKFPERMTKPQKITSKLIGLRAIIAICFGIALSLAILAFSNWVTTPNKSNPYFSYGANTNPEDIIHVIDNNKVEVPFSFDVNQGISEVILSLSGDHAQISGLQITEKRVAVINGKAVSKVIIQFDSMPALKPGTHFLTVVAKDRATGEIIRTGEIQFTYNMHEVVAKCSC